MPRNIAIGTVASPAMLKGDFKSRQSLINLVGQLEIDHVFLADHVSFQTGMGMDGLINAATIAAMHPSLRVCIGVYLAALRHPVTVARQLAYRDIGCRLFNIKPCASSREAKIEGVAKIRELLLA